MNWPPLSASAPDPDDEAPWTVVTAPRSGRKNSQSSQDSAHDTTPHTSPASAGGGRSRAGDNGGNQHANKNKQRKTPSNSNQHQRRQEHRPRKNSASSQGSQGSLGSWSSPLNVQSRAQPAASSPRASKEFGRCCSNGSGGGDVVADNRRRGSSDSRGSPPPGRGAVIHGVGPPETPSEQTAIRALAALLPSSFHLLHNFELCARPGAMAYEYDIVIVSGYNRVFHVEVKHYRGNIRGDGHRWRFENGHVFPSPIPLANKKSKIIASKLRDKASARSPAEGNKSNQGGTRARAGSSGSPGPAAATTTRVPFVDTILLITDDKARIRIQGEDQADRVWVLKSTDRANEALRRHLTAPKWRDQETLAPRDQRQIVADILGTNPVPKGPKTVEIGLYRVLDRIAQYRGSCGRYRNDVVVYLADHRYIHTRPKTVLKVFSLDLYDPDREQQLAHIFRGQEALRLLGSHPNIIRCGDFFASSVNTGDFVLPHEYLEEGRTLGELLEQMRQLAADEGLWGPPDDNDGDFGDDGDDRQQRPQLLLTWMDKLYIMEAIAQALLHCHNNGVIHRDVTPHSVIVAPPISQHHRNTIALSPQIEEHVLVKLASFDLALILDSEYIDYKPILLEDAKERLDPQYAAPEVMKDPWKGASEQSDVFSLGLLFYRLLTDNSHIPVEHHGNNVIKSKKAGGDESPNVMLDVSLLMNSVTTTTVAVYKNGDRRKKPPPPLTTPMAQQLVRMLQKMTHVDPHHRHSNMQEVIQELEHLNQQYKRIGGRTRSQLMESMKSMRMLLDDDDDWEEDWEDTSEKGD